MIIQNTLFSRKYILQTLVLFTFVLTTTSCAKRAAIYGTVTPVNVATEIPLSAPEVTSDIPSHVEFVEISEQESELTDNFSEFSTRSVRIQDPLLFAGKEKVVVNFAKIAESDYHFPLPGARVISNYGTRRGRQHTGIDIKTHANDTVRATFSGVVRMAQRNGAYGNVVVIRHYNGLETVYSHNSKHLVKVGTRVKAGTPLALVGRTGRATTEHVHFEIRVNGQPIDPNKIINFKTGQLVPQCLGFTQRTNGRIKIEELEEPIV
ncbi:MAG: M23 family metallopeptidase [Marinifilaceae bacterium]